MISTEQYERILAAFPLLHQAEPELKRDLQQHAFWATLPPGRDVYVEGARVDAIALLISGKVRVYKIGETGREITLYRFGLGQSCILTANAILSQQLFPAIATVEETADAVLIPAAIFRQWVDRCELWRNFVFELLSQRLINVLTIVDEVAFRRMDARIASFLLARGRWQQPITVTHQEIAAELGTSREVVTRILQDMAAKGYIAQERGKIEILDASCLQERAEM